MARTPSGIVALTLATLLVSPAFALPADAPVMRAVPLVVVVLMDLAPLCGPELRLFEICRYMGKSRAILPNRGRGSDGSPGSDVDLPGRGRGRQPAASRRLHTLLATVSRKVSELESHLRTELFNRSSYPPVLAGGDSSCVMPGLQTRFVENALVSRDTRACTQKSAEHVPFRKPANEPIAAADDRT
jgi:hypothetical protein